MAATEVIGATGAATDGMAAAGVTMTTMTTADGEFGITIAYRLATDVSSGGAHVPPREAPSTRVQSPAGLPRLGGSVRRLGASQNALGKFNDKYPKKTTKPNVLRSCEKIL